MKRNYKIIITVLVLLIIAGVVGFAISNFQKSQIKKPTRNLDTFAKCLTQKGAEMYGAYWCPHCQRQKKLFGDSFKYVKYIECTKETKKCEAKKVKGYPTWLFKVGKSESGEMSLEELAKRTSCKLPSN